MSAETVKKTKAPAKPKTAVKTQADATKSAVKAKAVKTAAKTKTIDVAATSAPSYEEIAQLAQRYWAERGYHDGQAEQDWLRAEHELAGAAS
jgi:hypothetical protein